MKKALMILLVFVVFVCFSCLENPGSYKKEVWDTYSTYTYWRGACSIDYDTIVDFVENYIKEHEKNIRAIKIRTRLLKIKFDVYYDKGE